jgi:hypothetical protein
MHPSVRWMNFYSRQDPVARGPLRRPKAESVWDWGGAMSFEDRAVVNQMDMFSDHSAYWSNAEEVIAPILNTITGNAMKADLQMRFPDRRYRVAILAALKSLAWLVFPAVFVPVMFFAGDTPVPELIKDIANYLLGTSSAEPQWWHRYIVSPLVSATLASVAAALVYSTVVKWLWDLRDQAMRYRRPASDEEPGGDSKQYFG